MLFRFINLNLLLMKNLLRVGVFLLITQVALAQSANVTPLFQDQQPLTLKLTTSIKDIKKKTNDSTYLPAQLYVRNASGAWDSIQIEVRARGIFRRKNCYFAPIRIKVKKEAAKGTILEGNKSLKLVMPCENNSDKNLLVLKEYAAYKMYEPITPYHFKTRMANLTFIESDGKKAKTHELVAFLIEDDDLVAKRYNAKIMENLNLHPLRLNDTSSVKHDLFQYMIGNLDWSTTFLHNSKIMLQPTNRYIPLAYDFDMSGFVNPPYGVPNEQLGQQDIRDRIYRGFCRQEPVVQFVRQHYLTLQPEVMSALGQFEKDFPPKEYATMKRYIDDFFAILKNDGDFRKKIIEGCRKK